MNPDPEGAASREVRRRRRLKGEVECVLCGETRTAVLERQHYVGRANDPDDEVTLCRNCHGVETAALRDLGVSMAPPQTELHRAISIVGGIGRLLASIGEALMWLAGWLQGVLDGLDADYPQWRHAPWAAR